MGISWATYSCGRNHYVTAAYEFALIAGMRAAHGRKEIEESFSTHQMAEEIHAMWSGMVLLLSTSFWRRRFSDLSDAEIAKQLKRLARDVELAQYRKVTRQTRHPPPKRTFHKNSPHVSTARILQQRK